MLQFSKFSSSIEFKLSALSTFDMYYNKRNLKMIADNLQLLTESFDRDKVLRLTQYLARICVWIFSDNNFPAGSIGIWPLLTKQTALVRRLSRLGKNFQYYQNIIQTSLTKDKDHVEFLTTMGHQIGIAAFLSCDALIALDTLGLYKLKNLKRVQMEASRMWSVAIMCNFVSGLHALRKLRLPKRFGENNDIADYQCMSM